MRIGSCVVACGFADDKEGEGGEESVENSPFAEARATEVVGKDGADGSTGGSAGDVTVGCVGERRS